MIAAPGKCHPLWQQPTCCLDTLSCNFVKIFPIDFVGLSPSLFPLSCCLPVVLAPVPCPLLPLEVQHIFLFHSARSYGNEMCFYFSFTSFIFVFFLVCVHLHARVFASNSKKRFLVNTKKKNVKTITQTTSSVYLQIMKKLQFSIPRKWQTQI